MIPLLRLCQAESCPAFVLGLALLASLGGGEVELLVSIFLASAPCILTTRLTTIIHSNVIKLIRSIFVVAAKEKQEESRY